MDHFKISCGHPILFAIECKKHNIKKPPYIIFWFFFQWLWKKIEWRLDFFPQMWKIEYWVVTSYYLKIYLFLISFLKCFIQEKTLGDHLMLFVFWVIGQSFSFTHICINTCWSNELYNHLIAIKCISN